MERPLVSVIIPNFNYAGFVAEAVESVLNQTYPNVETIVVDDGSTDGSDAVLKGFGERIKCVFQENQGVSVARNHGAEISKGNYLAFLDADDVWEPEKVLRQIELFESENDLGLVLVGVKEIDAKGMVLREVLSGSRGSVSKDLLLFKENVILGGGSGIMIPRAVFEELEGFDPDLMTSADWDLFFRISREYQVGFVAEGLLKYRFHGSNMHGNIRRMEREMLRGYEKAFQNGDTDLQTVKREAYANLHQVLSGSYFRTGEYSAFVKHALRSIFLDPSKLIYFAKYPVRKWKRD